MRVAIAASIGWLVVSTVHASGGRVPDASVVRVRAMQEAGERLLAEGMARSATFRRLANRLERSDVIVYIDVRPDMPAQLGGSLRFIVRSATDRFLRIQVNRAFDRATQVAMLGHELQHAVEVADAPDVSSAGDLRALYHRVGVRTGPDTYDSVAAQQAGYVVRGELAQSRHPELRFARSPVPAAPLPQDETPGAAAESLSDSVPAATSAGAVR
jgi:hypothetical protein